MAMANARKTTRAAWALLLALAAAPGGCYRPNIVDGGLRCADGGVCPEGFYCGANGLCQKGSEMVCKAPLIHVDPICAADPGIDCDPICQSRCDCGRCTLKGSSLGCTAPGTKQRGDLCNPDADDCAPGQICVKDCTSIARCFRLCGNGSITRLDQCEGQLCNRPVLGPDGGATPLTVCEPPVKTCNPVGGAMDCGSADLACYVSSTGQTVCDCKGTGAPGGPCNVFNSCIPGYRCITLGGASTCLRTCTLGVAGECSSGTTCTNAGGNSPFGFCPP
jgi:hypothetical protein